VVVSLGEPLRVTRDPLPREAGVMAPDIVQVGMAVAVKLTPVTLPPLTVTARFTGLKVNPALLAVTV
jgi:hypothetical protein